MLILKRIYAYLEILGNSLPKTNSLQYENQNEPERLVQFGSSRISQFIYTLELHKDRLR